MYSRKGKSVRKKSVNETQEEKIFRYIETSKIKAACYLATGRIRTWYELGKRDWKKKEYLGAAYCFSFCAFAPISFAVYAGAYIFSK